MYCAYFITKTASYSSNINVFLLNKIQTILWKNVPQTFLGSSSNSYFEIIPN